MKKISMLGIIMACSISLWAQQNFTPAFWMVETNARNRNFSIVRFYNVENELVNEITLDRYVDIRKSKHRRKLNRMLKEYNEKQALAVKRTRLRKSI